MTLYVTLRHRFVTFFSMGRYSDANLIFYLTQTYSKIPEQLVRDNENFLILFKYDDKNLRHIFDDHLTWNF